MNVRFATPEDCSALLYIYAQYIETPITFEYRLPSESEFKKRMVDISRDYPYLVCEEEDHRIVGYAYAHRQKEREAYQWNAELSVYLDGAFTSKGWGRKLYLILMEMLKCQGIRTVYGGVTAPNAKSEGLHETLGFHRAGVYRNTGYKCGRWHDVVWFEKEIAPYVTSPSPVLSISQIPKEQLDNILSCGQYWQATKE